MIVEERIRRCRIIEKMERNIEWAEKLGLSNSSTFREINKIHYNYKVKREVEK